MNSVNNFLEELETFQQNIKKIDDNINSYQKYNFRNIFIEAMNKVHPIIDSCTYISSEHYHWNKESYNKRDLYATKTKEKVLESISVNYGNRGLPRDNLTFTQFSIKKEDSTNANDNIDSIIERLNIKFRIRKIVGFTYEFRNPSYNLFYQLSNDSENIILRVKDEKSNNGKDYGFNSVSEFINSDIIDLLMIEKDITIPKDIFEQNTLKLKENLHKPKARKKNKI